MLFTVSAGFHRVCILEMIHNQASGLSFLAWDLLGTANAREGIRNSLLLPLQLYSYFVVLRSMFELTRLAAINVLWVWKSSKLDTAMLYGEQNSKPLPLWSSR
jgi:hypothetical protein